MARRRRRARIVGRGTLSSTWLRGLVVAVLGAALVATAGWAPVVLAALVVAVLLGVSSRRPTRRGRR